jgi:hypothetical protein
MSSRDRALWTRTASIYRESDGRLFSFGVRGVVAVILSAL